MVDYSNGRSMGYVLCTRPTIQIQVIGLDQPFDYHLKFELQKVWYSNVSGIQIVGIHIPTVFLIRFINFFFQDEARSVQKRLALIWNQASVMLASPSKCNKSSRNLNRLKINIHFQS